MKTPARIALGVLLSGIIAVGSYGSKLLMNSYLPYTLEHDKNFQGPENDNKLGAKFSRYLLSNNPSHKKHNRFFWEKNTWRLVSSEKELVDKGFFKNLKHKKQSYKDAKSSDKNKVFNDLVDRLILECIAQYSVTIFKFRPNINKWREFWTYCSIDGKDRWNEQKKLNKHN